MIKNYETLKNEILKDDGLAKYISTLSGQLEFTGIISQYESETSSYFSALGVEPIPALKLGAFDRLLSGSDLSRVKHNEVTLGSGPQRRLTRITATGWILWW